MGKKWFWILVIVFIVIFSSSVYSKLSENEKSRLEKCPLKTYINVTGNGIWGKGCFDVTIEKGYNGLYVDTICDWFTIDPFTEKGLGGKSRREGPIYRLYDFKAEDNPYFLACEINKTRLKNIEYLYIYVRSRLDLEKETREIEIHKKLDIIINKTNIAINKSEETLQKTNESKIIIEKINITTQQTNATLTTIQKSQNCKEKFGLWPEFLGIVLEIIFVVIGFTNKRNKRFRRRLWILAAIVIILVIIARLIITFFICNY